jgi:hypothetical protein
MADNVDITAGSGTTVHADEYTHGTLGSGKTQLVKLADGTLDADAAIAADIGVKANALRVAPASDITDATYIGDIKFGEAEPNSAAILADTTAILADTASMDTNLGTVAGAVTGSEMQVDVVAALPAGTNNIGDVDVLTLPGTAAEAAALPSVFVVVAGDDGTDTHPLQLDASGHLQVDIAADSVGVGGGTQYTEDDVAAADPTGNMPVFVREDSPVSVAADGDVVAQRCTAYGAGFVQVVDSSGNFIDTFGGAGGTAAADDADFVAGTTQGTPSMGVYESSPTSVTDGDLGTVGITSTRSLKVDETNSAAILADTAAMDTNLGTIAGAVAAGQMQVDIVADGAGLATSANQTTIIGHLDGVEGSLTDIETNTDFGAVVGGGTEATALRVTLANDSTGTLTVDTTGTSGLEVVQSSAGDLNVTEANSGTIASDTTSIDGKITACNTGNVTIGAELPAGTQNIGDVDIASSVALDCSAATITVDLGANNDVVCAGDVAHDSADSGNPTKIGGKAVNMDGSAPGTAVAENDRANLITDTYGRLLVETEHPNFWRATENYSTPQTNNELVSAPGAGLSLYITDIIVSNGATVGSVKIIEDTGGTPAEILRDMYFAVNGGAVISLRTPIKVAANKNIGFTSTSVTTHSVSVYGYTAP